ncbi:MAG: RNA-binding transcriptional accessory protein, partial [Bradymonadales bacterium]|nr:RNA-binding transcriptional accessory protein [Bradymonadales bacterium]
MQDTDRFNPAELIAVELQIPSQRIAATIDLFEQGNTVPFIARYRKEVTGNLDEVQIRAIQERQSYLIELEERRRVILEAIAQQGKLTDELARQIRTSTTKAVLEDLYLPYKPKRRTRATIALERGLLPLAEQILSQPTQLDVVQAAMPFVQPDQEVPDIEAAYAGARDIVAERISERAEVRALVRETYLSSGVLVSTVDTKAVEGPTKYEQYYNYREPVASVPSHRFLAIRRGEREEALKVSIEVDGEALIGRILRVVGTQSDSPLAQQLHLAATDAYKRLIAPSVETEVRAELKVRADAEAVAIFASNLRNLLLASPLGEKSVLGIDPGLRTGCKCAAVDATGKLLGHTTIYPLQGDRQAEKAGRDFFQFTLRHDPQAVAVGNGTGGRETETFSRRILKDNDLGDLPVVLVNEAGASVYSASDIAREEFPDLDLTIRGAISIARRLQDPLAELVKIDPKSIGVGQYQHDVHQPLLQRKLDEVVESCVNHVGVQLNTASVSLLRYVSGIGPSLAKKIVQHREQNGAFSNRQALLKVPGLGPKTFEQAAGFLRLRGSPHPLDDSAVHPERYSLVERMAADLGVELSRLVGDPPLVDQIDLNRYQGDGVGLPTLRDILEELKKPGRDPRQTLEPTHFREDVVSLTDLKPGMELRGVVTNVTAFGAFVDVGVKQDGLVHISKLSDRFIKDPH